MENPMRELEGDVYRYLLRLASELGEIAKKQVKREIITLGLISEEELYNSIEYVVSETISDVTLELFSTAPHAFWINYGTRPHFPNINTLGNWVAIKHSDLAAQQLQDLTWSIAKSIANKGTKAYKFFELGLNSAIPLMQKRIIDSQINVNK